AGALGSAAYYLLSDGREASSIVKLTFEDAIEPRIRASEVRWVTAADQRSLPEIASTEFRLHFNTALWNVDNTPQRVVNGRLSELALSTSSNGDYCAWFPVASISIPSDVPSTLTIRKEAGPAISAAFELDEGRRRPGMLYCRFSSSEDPASISVGRWRSIVG